MNSGKEKIADTFMVYLRGHKYPYRVYIFDHYRDYKKFIKLEHTRGLTWVQTDRTKNMGCICFSRQYLTPGVVVHETFHAVLSYWRYILKNRNMIIKTEEKLADMLERAVNKILRYIIRHGCFNKKRGGRMQKA